MPYRSSLNAEGVEPRVSLGPERGELDAEMPVLGIKKRITFFVDLTFRSPFRRQGGLAPTSVRG
jgi:hypothetical protein